MSGILLSALRSELREALGYDAIDLPDPDADLLLNRSWWQLQNILDLPASEVQTDFPTVAGQQTYAYDTTGDIEAILSLSVLNPDTQIYDPLELTDPILSDENVSLNTSSRKIPEKYFRFGESLFLVPIPDKIYTIRIRRRQIIADLTGAAYESLPANLHEIILYGAVSRGFLRQRDFDSVERFEQKWKDLLQMTVPETSKEQDMTRYASFRLLRANPYIP